MGKPKGRARKKFGKRGPDGRAVSKKPKLALQHELPPGSGDALSDGDDGVELMDVDAEEKKAAADEDVNDEDWCEEDPSGAHSSGGAGLARTMGAWMQRARREKEQKEEEESSSVGGEVGPVENPAVDLEVAPHAGSPGGGSICADSGDLEASSSCSSVGDMSIASGHGLLIEEFCSGQEMRDAEEVLEDNCDTSSDGFLDGLDFSSSSSWSSRSSDGCSSIERGGCPTPLDKEAVDVRQGAGENGEGGGTRLMPGEVCEKSNLVAAQYSMNKNYRVAKRKAPASERKTWTKTQLDRARGRARKHWTRRKAELMQTYRDAYDKLQKAEHSRSYDSVVADPKTMLDRSQLVHTTKVIHAVKHFVHLEIQEGVAKKDHSRAAVEVAKVQSKTVRRWVKEFREGGAFVVPKRQYNKREPHSFIEDEDKRNHSRHHKSVYVDGHDRPDIVNDRRGFVAYLLGRRKEMSMEVDGKNDYKHVRVYSDGETSQRVSGDCTRVAFDPRDLAASDSKGDYRLLPDEDVEAYYRPKKVKREELFWPAVRTVDGKEEYKHVRVHNPTHARGRDCVRVRRLQQCPCETRKDKGRCSHFMACECDDCKRKPAVDSAQVAFDKRDLTATDGKGDHRLLPDHQVLSLYFHDETTAKENDDVDHQWVSTKKGAPMKVKGEGRAAHISDVIGIDLGQLQISKEAWGMLQEDKDADTGRCGKYFGRKEGEGVHGHEVKEVQGAVEVLKTADADCAVLKTANDPWTAAVIVGQQHDGYWTSDRMCAQLPAIIAMVELTSGPHRPGVFIFDNSTGTTLTAKTRCWPTRSTWRRVARRQR
ncbi:unnamed protein product [Ectocarpus sp. CCAP 1310/34]|nr:unnamed protein product [Ectocarpus sp. CCAP 1310/34]